MARCWACLFSYRSWGYKPPADTDVWTAQDFLNYREFGGELTQQVGKHTKLVLKAYSGAQQDSSAQSTTGYGIEQHIGTVVLLGGYQNILTPALRSPRRRRPRRPSRPRSSSSGGSSTCRVSISCRSGQPAPCISACLMMARNGASGRRRAG